MRGTGVRYDSYIEFGPAVPAPFIYESPVLKRSLIQSTPIWLSTAIWLVTSPVIAQSSLLFTSLLEDKVIVAYARDFETGALTLQSKIESPAEPGFMAVSPDRRTLFVAFRSSGELASYRIQSSGALTLISKVPGGEDPCYLEVDKAGRFLLAAYYVANKVTVHALSADGEISGQPLQSIETAKNAHAITLNAANTYAFVAHTGGNRIVHFRFDETTGRLTPNSPVHLALSAGDEPRHISVHPRGGWAYANNEAGDSLNVLEISPTGTLERLQKVSTIPSGFDKADNTTARCEMTRDGQFIYVANRGHHSIAGFAIDQQTGRVTSLGQFETETTPRSFTISADGRFLYAAGQDSGKIAQYRIESDGRLVRSATYAPGKMPWCVLAVDLP